MISRKLLSGGLLALSLTALPVFAWAAPKTDLVVGGIAADVSQLDPHLATNTTDRTVVAWIFNGLVRFKPGSTDPALIEPDLAERWEASADKLVWTFHLRPGVKWQKGFGEVTADDVVFSIQKAMNKDSSGFSGDYAAFKSVEKIDDLTVRITLSQNIPSLLGVLANYSGGFVVPMKAVKEKGANFTRDPVGSGPFQIDAITSGQRIRLVANKDYFRGAPKLSSVTMRFLPESAARDLAFISGEIDAGVVVQDKNNVARLKAQSGLKVDVFAPAELAELHLNATKPPLDNLKVRQALSHAIDRSKIATFQGEEFTQAARSVVPSNNLGFTADNGMPGYDPAKAKALLAEAGYPNGLTIPMINSQDAGLLRLAQLAQAQLAEIGVTVRIQAVEHATYHQMIRQDASPIVLYSAARFPVADFYLTQFFYGPSQIGAPGQVTNFSHCKAGDAEIEAAKTETDEAKRIALWQGAQRKIMENACAIPMVESRLVWVRKDGLDWGHDFQGSMSNGPMITEATHFTK